jgi:hypothetical protein
MDALCRITLLKPFRNDPTFKVPLRDGQRSLIPMGAASVSDPSTHVGFTSDTNRFQAAQNIVYELGYGDEGSIIVTVGCAQTHFGDWTIRPGDTSQAAVKRTYGQERTRVAMQWGDYTRMPRGRTTTQGVEPDTRIIGLPEVPHVKIEVLEQNGLPYGEAFDPWAFYAWERDIDQVALREAQRMGLEPSVAASAPLADFSAFTNAQLNALIEAAQAAKGSKQSGKAQPAGA